MEVHSAGRLWDEWRFGDSQFFESSPNGHLQPIETSHLLIRPEKWFIFRAADLTLSLWERVGVRGSGSTYFRAGSISKCAEIFSQDRCICIWPPLPQAGEGWGESVCDEERP